MSSESQSNSLLEYEVDCFNNCYEDIVELSTEFFCLLESHSKYSIDSGLEYADLYLDDQEAGQRIDVVKPLLEKRVVDYRDKAEELDGRLDKNREPYIRERYEQIWREAESLLQRHVDPALDEM